jgi:hypothetical protein
VPADPNDVDFLVADDPGGGDEELPEPAGAPWWLRARVPLGVIAAVGVLAALLFRLTSAGPGADGPAGAPDTATPSLVVPTRTFLPTHGDPVKMNPPGIVTVPCDVKPQCIITMGAPHPVVRALIDHIHGAHVVIASTSLERTGIAGRFHHFRATTVLARRGATRIRLTISRATRAAARPTHAGEKETAAGTHIYARAHFAGYNVSIDVTGPSGRIREDAADILALATDDRLRPGH